MHLHRKPSESEYIYFKLSFQSFSIITETFQINLHDWILWNEMTREVNRKEIFYYRQYLAPWNISPEKISNVKIIQCENLTKQEPEESLILSENTEENQQNLQQENDSLLIENTSQQNQVADATKNISETTDLDIPITSSNYEKILQNSTTDYDYLTQNIALETMNSNQSIINAQTQNQVKQALEKLHQTQQTINNANGMVSDENLAKLISNMLEPKLTEWLNSNLSSMVEKIVQEEINKLFANKK